MLDEFTSTSRAILAATQTIARGLGHNYIGTEHVLLALLAEEEAVGLGPLTSRGITTDAAREQAIEWLSHYVQDKAALASVGVDAAAVVADARNNLEVDVEITGETPRKIKRPSSEDFPPDALPLTPRVFKVLHLAVGIAAGDHAEPRHILQALLEEDGGLAVVILDRLGVDLPALHADLATRSMN